VEETAGILLKNKISGVSVVDDDNWLAGIITQDDLFKVLTSITGIDKRGIEFSFLIEDRTISIIKLVDIIRKYKGRVSSLFSTYVGPLRGIDYRYFVRLSFHVRGLFLSKAGTWLHPAVTFHE
jgi:acetoin utilization protein AcuB